MEEMLTAELPKKRLKAKKGKRAKQRSMELLRAEHYFVGNAEYWSQFAGRTIDLFNFIDLVALPDPFYHKEHRIVAVQVTKNFLQEHITKIRSLPAARCWIECGGLIVLHHWRELGKKEAKKWVLEVISITL